MPRYAPARRLEQLRILLSSGARLSFADIMERLECSRDSAKRYVTALLEAGEPIVEELDGATKRWRLMPGAKLTAVRVSTGQMIGLLLSRKLVDVFEGTGLKEDLDEVYDTLAATLRATDFEAAADLDRKLHVVVSDGRRRYEGRLDDVDVLMTALLRQERVDATHESVDRGSKPFRFQPYTLLVYRGGLYFAGWTSHRDAVRTFALDGFSSVERRRGDRFEYPADFDPRALVGDAFGMIGGARTDVVLRFDASVARYVRRRIWHPSQELVNEADGAVTLRMNVEGTVELATWVRGWGSKVEVVAPAALRREIVEDAARIVERGG
ncbi:MAG: helix-turn-helix transcriptional regulator [Polyangiales bacterium]